MRHASDKRSAHADHRQRRVVIARRGLARLVTLAVFVVALVVAGCGGVSGSGVHAERQPAATATSELPTATVGPPTPTPTAQERLLTSLARQAIGDLAIDVRATFDAGARSVTVATTLGGSVPNSPADIAAAQERVKAICFRAQQALWTSRTTLSSVTVTVSGPILDQYADAITGAYGAAVLSANSAKRVTWDTLAPDTAWDQYDNVFLRPDFNDAS